jgi:hypothetical protein
VAEAAALSDDGGMLNRVQRMRCTGSPRGVPRIDGEQANACVTGDRR